MILDCLEPILYQLPVWRNGLRRLAASSLSSLKLIASRYFAIDGDGVGVWMIIDFEFMGVEFRCLMECFKVIDRLIGVVGGNGITRRYSRP